MIFLPLIQSDQNLWLKPLKPKIVDASAVVAAVVAAAANNDDGGEIYQTSPWEILSNTKTICNRVVKATFSKCLLCLKLMSVPNTNSKNHIQNISSCQKTSFLYIPF